MSHWTFETAEFRAAQQWGLDYANDPDRPATSDEDLAYAQWKYKDTYSCAQSVEQRIESARRFAATALVGVIAIGKFAATPSWLLALPITLLVVGLALLTHLSRSTGWSTPPTVDRMIKSDDRRGYLLGHFHMATVSTSLQNGWQARQYNWACWLVTVGLVALLVTIVD